MKIVFKIDFKGCWLVRFRAIDELPEGLVKREGAMGFVDIVGVLECNKVTPIEYNKLLEQVGMVGKYSEFKEMLGNWLEDRGLLGGEWVRISIEKEVGI